LSYHLRTVNDFHWELKPVLSYSKPHTFSTFFGEEKETNMHLLSPTRPAEQNESKLKKKGMKRENSMLKRLLPVKIITGP